MKTCVACPAYPFEPRSNEIQHSGGVVLGYRDLALDGVRGLREITHRAGGTVYLYEGARRLRAATSEEAATMQILGTWGYEFVERIAERHFVGGEPLGGHS